MDDASLAEYDGIYLRAGDKVHATHLATGPWHAAQQHGGAPASLIVWAAEQIASPTPMRVARLTVELMRPAPLGDIAIETQVLRQGRKVQLCQVRLIAADAEIARGTVLKIRTQDVSEELPAPIMPALDVPLPDNSPLHPWKEVDGGTPFNLNFDIRQPAQQTGAPVRVWFRQHRALIAGEPLSPAMRAVAVADYANGIATVLPWKKWTFINGDLTVSFARLPVGEWILAAAEMWAAQDGAGMTSVRLADVHGYFGQASQSLVLEPRTLADMPARARN